MKTTVTPGAATQPTDAVALTFKLDGLQVAEAVADWVSKHRAAHLADGAVYTMNVTVSMDGDARASATCTAWRTP